MTLIVDTSVVLKWVIWETGSEAAESLLMQSPIAPDLLRAELANALSTKVRKQEIGAAQALAAQAVVEDAVAFIPSMPFARRALELALELSHPAYDCFFLALAESLQGVVVTADSRFFRQCADTRYGGYIRMFTDMRLDQATP